jgi:transposase-like protein
MSSRSIGGELGEVVRHRTNVYLNNRLEQDHRGIKDRYQPMRGLRVSVQLGDFVVRSMSSEVFYGLDLGCANMFRRRRDVGNTCAGRR